MNNKLPLFPFEDSLRQTWDELRDFVHREPAKAATAAFVVGLSVGLLPARWVARAVTTVGGTLVRPALIVLGASKIAELCSVPTEREPFNPNPRENNENQELMGSRDPADAGPGGLTL